MTKTTNLLAIAATLLTSGAAQATTFNCASSVLNYRFSLAGTIRGDKVVGSAVISVTQGGKPLRRGALPISSSRFAPNQALQVNAADAHSKIVVDASFQNGAYVGPMSINSDQGNVNLTATCSVR